MAYIAGKRPPKLSWNAISALILELFPFKHVSTNSLKTLPSYDDSNFYFEGTRDPGEETAGTVGADTEAPFVLKICNSGISTEVVEGMNEIMLFLKERGIPCCSPIFARNGRHLISASEDQLLQRASASDAESDARFTVRVLKYIPGTPMDKLDKKFLSNELFYSVGNLAGRMDSYLQVYIIRTRINIRKTSSNWLPLSLIALFPLPQLCTRDDILSPFFRDSRILQ